MFASESVLPDAEVLHCFHKLREKVPTARRVIAAHWDRFLTDAPGLRAGHGQGQVRRLPADAPRRPRRGVPQRDHRPALRLGLDGPRPGGRLGQDRLAGPRRAHPGDPRLPRPDGHAERLLRARLRRRPLRPGHVGGRAGVPAGLRAQPAGDPRDQRPRRRDRALRRAHRARPRPRRRRRRRRRRAGRSRGRGVRRLRGALDGDPRGRGDRRPGRHQLDDPQLPRLPARHLRHAAGPAGPQPGAALRRAVLHRAGRRRAAARASTATRTCCAPRAARCAPGRW